MDSSYRIQLYVGSVDTNSGNQNCALSIKPALQPPHFILLMFLLCILGYLINGFFKH